MRFILDYDSLNTQEELEQKIRELNEAHRAGGALVEDAVYDDLVNKLEELFPGSLLLQELWSGDDEVEDDEDKYLLSYPLKSIRTVKSFKDVGIVEFRKKLEEIVGQGGLIDLCCSAKLNGHSVRIVYQDGVLVKARSRGRVNTRDLTKQMKVVVGDIPKLKGKGLVELRGELVLPMDLLEQARELNPVIKNAFTAVSSLVKESDDSGYPLLSFVCFDIIGDSLKFKNLSSVYEYIRSIGLECPKYIVRSVVPKRLSVQIEEIVADMDIFLMDYKYFTDGVVAAVDNREDFKQVGEQSKYRFGNIALKVGRWQQDSYSAIVESIEFTRGKGKRTPVAIIEPTLTVGGNTVTRVPLFTPLNILLLEAFPGNVLYFRYGGESGVLPAKSDGTTVIS